MGVIADALDNLQANKYPYAIVLPTLLQTKYMLNDLKSNSNAIVYSKPLLTAVVNGFNKRFDEIMDLNHKSSLPALIAATTHPFFKLRWLNPEICTIEQTDKIKQILSYAADEISLGNTVGQSSNKVTEETNENEGSG